MMSTWILVVVLIVAVLALFSVWASSIARRLHRLNIRTDAALLSLDGALGRRAAVVSAIWPELTPLARRAQSIPMSRSAERLAAEHELAQAIPDTPEINARAAAAVADVQVRVELAIRFYNEAVLDTRNLRLRPVVRFFRLGGHAAAPVFFEAAGIETAMRS